MSKLVARARFAWLIAGILSGFSAQAWAYSGDTIQDDIAREFNGATSYTIPLSAPTQSVPTTPPANNCETTLQQEMGTGEIPTDEECYCPVGATQPVCTALPESDCPNLLQIEENRLGSDAQYYDCTCPTGATSPQCTSYYNLCEANLPNYQNSTNECSCSHTATSAVPECTSDYSICESHAGSYENSTTTCTCSQTSTSPDCCTTHTTSNCTTNPNCTTIKTITGYTCNTNINGYGSFWYAYCANNNGAISYSPNLPANFCGGGYPGCTYHGGSFMPVYATPDYTPTQQCNPVTTCHPVTTTTCTQEPVTTTNQCTNHAWTCKSTDSLMCNISYGENGMISIGGGCYIWQSGQTVPLSDEATQGTPPSCSPNQGVQGYSGPAVQVCTQEPG